MKVSVISFSYKRGLPEDKTGNDGLFRHLSLFVNGKANSQ